MLAAVAGGTLYTVGSHSVAGGKKCQGVASFEIATGDLTAWAPLPDYTGGVSTVADDTVYMEADDGRTGVARRSVTAVDARAGQALAWRGDIEGFDGGHIDGLAVVGAFGKVSGKPKESLAAINSVTGATKAWNPATADDDVFSLLATPAGLLANRTFAAVGGVMRRPRTRTIALPPSHTRPRATDPKRSRPRRMTN